MHGGGVLESFRSVLLTIRFRTCTLCSARLLAHGKITSSKYRHTPTIFHDIVRTQSIICGARTTSVHIRSGNTI